MPPPASGRPAVLLLSDVTGVLDKYTSPLTFGDGYTKAVPSRPFSNDIYKPTDFAPADTFPGVDTPHGITMDLSDLTGMNPTGDWSLYIVDDQNGQTGFMDSGWSLMLHLGVRVDSSSAPLSIVSPALSRQVTVVPGSSVTVAGLTDEANTVSVQLHGLTHSRPRDLDCCCARRQVTAMCCSRTRAARPR